MTGAIALATRLELSVSGPRIQAQLLAASSSRLASPSQPVHHDAPKHQRQSPRQYSTTTSMRFHPTKYRQNTARRYFSSSPSNQEHYDVIIAGGGAVGSVL
eukprot:CAMPEP_0183713764 /NCGR_PEP_ID=MMETSP0737-20130205/8517_1 /TAXON_ID=385413 /ORGANISM="Thalassiosira miniscula, Strain CCMP1093" /LENGTH=100 /DNA_ID=CAMNT_0025942597 /DNA_START=45 /DNA_END=344 /DNA_ORIENTATION=+